MVSKLKMSKKHNLILKKIISSLKNSFLLIIFFYSYFMIYTREMKKCEFFSSNLLIQELLNQEKQISIFNFKIIEFLIINIQKKLLSAF